MDSYYQSFEFLSSTDKKNITSNIGEFLGHKILKGLSADEINNLDLCDCADYWINYVRYNDSMMDIIERNDLSERTLIKDISLWMDARIPKVYKKMVGNERHKSVANQIIRVDDNGVTEEGIIYHFEVNKKYAIDHFSTSSKFEIAADQITPRQLNYLKSLAISHNYMMTSEKMTKKAASSFISYFKEYDYAEEPESFNKYFSKVL